MRAFIATELPDEVKEELKKIQDKIYKIDILRGKFVESENLHLTLKFLGDINDKELDLCKQALESIKFKKFKTKLNEIGFFSPSFIRIIWIGLGGKEFYDLHNEIDKSLKDIFIEDKRFESHVTLMRVKRINDKEKFMKFIEKTKLKEIEFSVENFKLMKSELTRDGPIYEDVEVYNLE